jgi:hypothetical protein
MLSSCSCCSKFSIRLILCIIIIKGDSWRSDTLIVTSLRFCRCIINNPNVLIIYICASLCIRYKVKNITLLIMIRKILNRINNLNFKRIDISDETFVAMSRFLELQKK